MPKHRHLPHLLPFACQPVVFLTAVTRDRKPVLANREAFDCLTTIWQCSAEIDGWFVGDYLLMPDHVHFFARAAIDGKPLAQWIETWKSLSARRLKAAGKIIAPLWQRDYFDRFLRSTESYAEKWDYVANNPVRAGFCGTPTEWPWRGRLHDLRF